MIFEEPNDSLQTAQEAVRDLIFTPKPSKEQIQTSKELKDLKEETSEKNNVVVPPKRIDSICICEEEMEELNNVRTTETLFEKSKRVTYYSTVSSTNEKSSYVESRKPLTPELVITPAEDETKQIAEEKVEKDNKDNLSPDGDEIAYKTLSISEVGFSFLIELVFLDLILKIVPK